MFIKTKSKFDVNNINNLFQVKEQVGDSRLLGSTTYKRKFESIKGR